MKKYVLIEVCNEYQIIDRGTFVSREEIENIKLISQSNELELLLRKVIILSKITNKTYHVPDFCSFQQNYLYEKLLIKWFHEVFKPTEEMLLQIDNKILDVNKIKIQ